MADLALSAVQTLIAALIHQQLQEFCCMLVYKSHLKDIEKTISTVKTVLIGAEIREGEFSPEQEDDIQTLKDAVCNADDLFDEVLALAELSKSKEGGKLTKKFVTDRLLSTSEILVDKVLEDNMLLIREGKLALSHRGRLHWKLKDVYYDTDDHVNIQDAGGGIFFNITKKVFFPRCERK